VTLLSPQVGSVILDDRSMQAGELGSRDGIDRMGDLHFSDDLIRKRARFAHTEDLLERGRRSILHRRDAPEEDGEQPQREYELDATQNLVCSPDCVNTAYDS
jgi:hypothetical protein